MWPSFRNYSGPTSHAANMEKSRLHSGGRSGVYSPVIEIDDDSHSRQAHTIASL